MATVGRFSMTSAGVVTGPADYMKERWPAFKAKLESGQSAVFNYGAGRGGSLESLVLVAVQTDYAAWRGYKSLFGGNS